jgi:hypothetical protein
MKKWIEISKNYIINILIGLFILTFIILSWTTIIYYIIFLIEQMLNIKIGDV